MPQRRGEAGCLRPDAFCIVPAPTMSMYFIDCNGLYCRVQLSIGNCHVSGTPFEVFGNTAVPLPAVRRPVQAPVSSSIQVDKWTPQSGGRTTMTSYVGFRTVFAVRQEYCECWLTSDATRMTNYLSGGFHDSANQRSASETGTNSSFPFRRSEQAKTEGGRTGGGWPT